jgi:hypothetical protein
MGLLQGRAGPPVPGRTRARKCARAAWPAAPRPVRPQPARSARGSGGGDRMAGWDWVARLREGRGGDGEDRGEALLWHALQPLMVISG